MKTLEEHFDDLDRMIDTSASKPAIRDQVAFLWKQVAALQADYASAVEHDAQTTEAKAKVEAELAALKARNRQATDDWLRNEAEKHRQLIQSKQLKTY